MLSRPKKLVQHRGRRAAEAGMARDVAGERRRRDQRRPGRVRGRIGIAVGVGRANSGDRPPEIGGELRVPGHDRRVGQRHVEHREQPGVLGERVALLLGDHDWRHDVQMPRRRGRAAAVGPEQGDVRLIGGPRGAADVEPSDFTSLNAAVYSALVSAGMSSGENCEPLVMANGVTVRPLRQERRQSCPAASAASRRDRCRACNARRSSSRRWPAAPASAPPHSLRVRRPGLPPLHLESSPARRSSAASNVAAWAGNRLASVAWAAAATAASRDVSGEASTSTA